MAGSKYIPKKAKKKRTPLEKAVETEAGTFVREKFYCAKCCRTYFSGYRYLVSGVHYTICSECRYKIRDEQPSGSVWAISTAM